MTYFALVNKSGKSTLISLLFYTENSRAWMSSGGYFFSRMTELTVVRNFFDKSDSCQKLL